MSPRKPAQKATVIKTACEQQTNLSTSRADQSVLDKIQKCLNRAYHANVSEAEAKTALFLSQKLMSEHNVTQADLIANNNQVDKAQYSGRSIVRIVKFTGSSQRVMREAFIERVATAMCTFFNCKTFSTDFCVAVEWSFFSIASNTVAAAMAFEMVHNLILEWACGYKGGPPTFSYRLGIADGLQTLANREKRREMAGVQRKEPDSIAFQDRVTEKQHQRGLDKLAVPSSEAEECDSASDNDDKDMDPFKVESDDEHDRDFSNTDGLNIKADFNIDDVQIIDLCDDVDESINNYIK